MKEVLLEQVQGSEMPAIRRIQTFACPICGFSHAFDNSMPVVVCPQCGETMQQR